MFLNINSLLFWIMVEHLPKIIFCQGDKTEIEEITGEEYEYIKPEDIRNVIIRDKDYSFYVDVYPTFIESFNYTINTGVLKRSMYNMAL